MNRSGSSDSAGRSWRVGTLGRTLGRKDAGAKPPPAQDRERYDPRRFQGLGVTFKGKLIGVLAVTEARGDRMCQDALAELKMAIRAAGEHKQKVVISVGIDGLRLRDERCGDCLYHHPVHKISFIAQDMTDKRAFGYVFGSPDTGHQFFGVKTEKDAGQVVMAMRDLFQVVFEMKKQEMEKKKQRIAEEQLRKSGSATLSRTATGKSSVHVPAPTWALGRSALSDSVSALSVHSGHSVDLLDLQMEIENIEQGISQMDHMSPVEDAESGCDSVPPRGSPALARAATLSAVITTTAATTTTTVTATATAAAASTGAATAAADPFGDSFVPSPRLARRGRTTSSGGSGSGGVPVAIAPPPTALTKSRHSSSGSGRGVTPQPRPTPPASTIQPAEPETAPAPDPFHLFTDLDPLGSGKAKPYVDKKDFFSDLKKPKPRLGDLVGGDVLGSPHALPGQQPPRPLDKQTLMELYESEEKRQADASFGDDFNVSGTVNGTAGNGSESSFVTAEEPLPAPAASAVTFSTDFSVFDFECVSDRAAAGEPESMRADSPPAFSPPPVPLPPPPGRPAAAASRSGSSSPPLRRGYLKQTSSSSDALSEPAAESGEAAPEPPPRPALVQPPPLPPKKAPQHVTMKPPPRPPHAEARWDAAVALSLADAVGSGSPPLPVPARRPRQDRQHADLARASSLGGAAVHRKARETASLGFTSLPPLAAAELAGEPWPLAEPPPVNRHTKDRGRSAATAAHDETPAADLVTQLQSTSLTELAGRLNISVDRLAQMSVIELAACLVASGTAVTGPSHQESATPPPPPPPPLEEESQEESPSEEFKSLSPISSPEVSIYKSPQLQRRDLERGFGMRSPPAAIVLAKTAASPPPPAAQQPRPAVPPAPLEMVEEDVFARFDAKFPRSPVDTPNSPDDRHCEFPGPAVATVAAATTPHQPVQDKYAVFRELEAELTGERRPVSTAGSDDSESAPTASDPWSLTALAQPRRDAFDDDFGGAAEPAPAQDFARFECEFGATVGAGAGSGQRTLADVSWGRPDRPPADDAWPPPSPQADRQGSGDDGRPASGNGGQSGSCERRRFGSAAVRQSASSASAQFGSDDGGQFGSEDGQFVSSADAQSRSADVGRTGSAAAAAGWGRADAEAPLSAFEPPAGAGWERLGAAADAAGFQDEPGWERPQPVRTQTSQFDDDFVQCDERGSLADEVSFDERRHSPVVDDVFGSTDPWAAAEPNVTAADPFADDEFFQSPLQGIQSDPFKQGPLERSWASDFNAARSHQQ